MPRHQPGPTPNTVAVTVAVHELDEPATSWCDRCALPSVVHRHWALEVNGYPLEVVRMRRCTDCGEEPN